MYAIIKTGSKQYRVKSGDFIDVELLPENDSKTVSFEEVLLIGSEGKVQVGSPTLKGAIVKGELVGQIKDEKLIIFKYRKRKHSQVKKGHRQKLSRVKITSING
jgi:large subunit ribosomal protein L21